MVLPTTVWKLAIEQNVRLPVLAQPTVLGDEVGMTNGVDGGAVGLEPGAGAGAGTAAAAVTLTVAQEYQAEVDFTCQESIVQITG